MNILAVDTTGEGLSLALSAGGRVYRLERRGRRPHDETLLPAVDSLLGRAKLAPEKLDAIAAAAGPGRFTGIRIGMAYAAVAAALRGIPALAVSRLEAAAGKVPGERLCAALAGFRGETYYQIFRRRGEAAPRPEGEPVWASPEQWARVQKELKDRGVLVYEAPTTAADLLEPARRRLARRRRGPFEPLYLKPAGYEAKRHQARPVR